MLFSIIIAAILVGLLRGGRINRLLSLRFKGHLLVLSSLIIEVGMLYLMTSESRLVNFLNTAGFISTTFVIVGILLQYSLLFLFIFLNRKLSYSWLMFLGSLLNFLVIILNSGSMPLSNKVLEAAAGSQSLKYLLEGRYLTYAIINDTTKLSFLGDIIYIPSPVKGFISVGDILLFAGIFMLVQGIIISGEHENRRSISIFQKERSL